MLRPRGRARALRGWARLTALAGALVLAVGLLPAPALAATAPTVTSPGNQVSPTGTALSLTMAASGGTKPYAWTATGLPAGLTINSSTGVVSGTPTTAGTYSTKVTATDAAKLAGSASFTWRTGVVVAAPGTQNSATGVATSLTLSASGGTKPYTWTATGLPAGLSLNASTGVVSGTPTTAGTYTTTVTATDTAKVAGSASFTWTAGVLVTNPGTQNSATGVSASLTLSASGGKAPYTWTATGLPAGLSLNASTGVVSGKPTTAGTYSTTVTATDTAKVAGSTTFTWTTGVVVANPGTLASPTGVAASVTMTASGGTKPYAWTATGLPAGLTINSSTGVVSGTPTTAGTYSTKVTATDTAKVAGSASFTWKTGVVVGHPANQTGTVGVAVSLTMTASGGTKPYTWTATGLPAGLSVNASTGVISGTPGAAGTYSATLTATDAAKVAGSTTVGWTVATPVAVTRPANQNATIGTTATLTLAATGGAPGYTWSATGLPAGLSLNATTGTVTGTPTATGTSTVTVTATDTAARTGSASFTWVVATGVGVTNPGRQASATGTATTLVLSASGGVGPYTWSAAGLPGGLSVNSSTGTISGTPTSAGTATVTVTATDTGNRTGSATFTWVAGPAPLVTNPGAQYPTLGAPVYVVFGASNGTGPYTWSATGLPPGLSIDPVAGTVTGTATAAGGYTSTVSATDANGIVGSTTVAWNAANPVTVTGPADQLGDVGQAVSVSVSASGGTGTYAWSAASLPPGVSIDPKSGAITGTPGAPGRYTVTVTATDTGNRSGSASFAWQLYAAPATAPVLAAGTVSTLTGSGALAGSSSASTPVGGVTFLGGAAYVVDGTRLVRVDPVAGAVTPIAGASGTPGCQDSSSGTGARFAPYSQSFNAPRMVGTDGSYVYLSDACGLRRVDPATGATLTVDSVVYGYATIAGRYFYGVNNGTVYRRDLSTLASTTVLAAGSSQWIGPIAADATSVWTWDSSYGVFQRIDIATGTRTTVATFPAGKAPYASTFLSVGDYLYAAFRDSNGAYPILARVSKATGSIQLITGSGTEGMSSITGIATDGQRLYVADTGTSSSWLRAVAPATPAAFAPVPSAPVLAAGTVTTLTAPGALTAAATPDRTVGGVTMLGGFAYVVDGTRIVRVDPGTGAVTTVAGTAGNSNGCQDAPSGSDVRFAPYSQSFDALWMVGNDGSYVYVTDACGLRKIDPATGATETLDTVAYGSGTIAGQYFYGVSGGMVYRRDLATLDPATPFATASSEWIRPIAADATSVWTWDSSYNVFQRIDIATGTRTTVATYPPAGTPYATSFLSVGDYIYTAFRDGNGGYTILARVSKATGSMQLITGTGTEGMSSVTGLATDGQRLYVSDTDTSSSWLRAIAPATPAAYPGPATAQVMEAGSVSTVTGSLAGSPSAYQPVGGVTMLGGSAYVVDGTRVVRVNPATGTVTPVAGTLNNTGACQNAPDGTGVRFAPYSQSFNAPWMIGNDGSYVYVSDACGFRKIDPSTGATQTVDSNAIGWSAIVGQYAYGMRNGTVYRRNLATLDAATVFANTGDPTSDPLAWDGTSLWFIDVYDWALERLDPATGTRTIVRKFSGPYVIDRLVSVGDYLYASYRDPKSNVFDLVVRFGKSDGGAQLIAGGPGGGYADGVLTDALFTNITGIATDGSRLYVADTARTGSWLRAIRGVKLPTAPGGPSGWRETTGGSNPSENGDCTVCHGDPVQTDTGALVEPLTDLSTPGRGVPLVMSRTYSSTSAQTAGPVGYGWAWSYGMNVSQPSDQPGTVYVTQEDGSVDSFTRQADGTYATASRVLATLTNNADGTWTFTRRQRETFTFDSAGRLTGQTDRNGYTTRLGYDSGNRLATVTDPAGRTMSFSYDSAGLISTVSGPSGTVTYTHDAAGNLTGVTDPAGASTSYGYDAGHLMTSITDARGTITNGYDSAGRVVTQTDQAGRRTTFGYVDGDQAGTVTTTTTAPDGTATVERYVDGQLLSQTRAAGTPLAAMTTYTYDPVTSQRATVTDPAGHTTTYTYDAAGDRLTATDPMGYRQQWTYDAAGDLTGTVDRAGTATTSGYDANGDLLSVTVGGVSLATYAYGDARHPGDLTAVTDADGRTTRYTYTADGDLATVTAPDGAMTVYTYDQAGRRTSATDPRGDRTTYGLDADGRTVTVNDPAGHTTTYTYDAAGNPSSTTDPEGHVTTRTFDARGNVTGTVQPDGSTVSYRYDAVGQRTAYTDAAGHTTTYAHDALGELTSVTDPLGRTTTVTYDASGNRTGLTAADGSTTTYGYDADGRLTATSAAGAPTVTYTYDPAGRRLTMTDGTGTTRYGYDAASHLVSVVDGAGRSVGYAYDAAGNQTAITYPNGRTVTRGYDAAGRLASVTDWNGGTTAFGYDASGELTTTTYPNGVVGSTSFDGTGHPTGIVDSRGTTTLASFSYTRGANGELTGTATNDTGQPAEQYSYDSLGRLTAAGTNAYGYDTAGNLTTLAGTSATYDAAGQLTGTTDATGTTTVYGYDARGDRTSATSATDTTTYSYDLTGRLAGVTRDGAATTYTYNGEGLRVTRTGGAGTVGYVWDHTAGDVALLLSDGDASYVYGPNGRAVEEIDGSGVTSYLHQDQLGSTRLVTDTSGAVVATYAFDAYGNTTAHTGTAVTNLLYAGQYRDAESGLYYLRARYYDPATAQFLTVDPLAALTQALYGYAGNSPLNAVDPLGLTWWKPNTWTGKTWATIGLTVAAVGLAVATCGVGDVVLAGATITEVAVTETTTVAVTDTAITVATETTVAVTESSFELTVEGVLTGASRLAAAGGVIRGAVDTAHACGKAIFSQDCIENAALTLGTAIDPFAGFGPLTEFGWNLFLWGATVTMPEGEDSGCEHS